MKAFFKLLVFLWMFAWISCEKDVGPVIDNSER